MASPGKIVVLGGTGFVGRTLVGVLQAHGYAVDVLSRNRERLRDLLVYPQVRVLSTNVYDTAALQQRLVGADAVINLIGVLQNNGMGGRDYERAHVELARTLIAAMRGAGVRRLLQMSALNAGAGDSHYLRTRGEAERLVKASELDWTIFQPSVIFGPGDGLYQRFGSLLQLLPVLPLARASARFQPVYVKDVAAAMALTLERPESIRQIYPLVGPNTYTLGEIADYSAQMIGKRRLVFGLPNAFGRLQGLFFDPLPAAIKPFSSDNFRSLAHDSVSTRNGLTELGIRPTPPELIVPDYLSTGDHQRALDQYRADR
jgi:NADH dehydrogenase